MEDKLVKNKMKFKSSENNTQLYNKIIQSERQKYLKSGSTSEGGQIHLNPAAI